MTTAVLILAALFLITVAALAGYYRGQESVSHELERSENACRELRDSLLRGTAVTHWRSSVNPDDRFVHLKTTHGDLLITLPEFDLALERARKHLRQ